MVVANRKNAKRINAFWKTPTKLTPKVPRLRCWQPVGRCSRRAARMASKVGLGSRTSPMKTLGIRQHGHARLEKQRESYKVEPTNRKNAMPISDLRTMAKKLTPKGGRYRRAQPPSMAGCADVQPLGRGRCSLWPWPVQRSMLAASGRAAPRLAGAQPTCA